MSRDVLVAMDRGGPSADALAYALEEYPGATVHVVHVTEANDPLDLFGTREPTEYMIAECGVDVDDEVMPDGNAFNRHQRKRAEQVLEDACRLSDEYGREIEPAVRSGDTAREIRNCAEEREVDHIVLPDRYASEIGPSVRSVPESVARKADRPITIVC